MLDAVYLLRGKTAHTRTSPKRHAFKYGVTLIDIDVSRIEEANQASKLFSVDRQNLVSLNLKKFLSGTSKTALDWVKTQFETAGIHSEKCQYRFISFPRTELFSFAPLSIWLALDDDQNIKGLIYDVHNTFGERHCYVSGPVQNNKKHRAEKHFHVSPFFDVSGKYQFQIHYDKLGLKLLILNYEDSRVIHSASLDLTRKPLSSASLLRFLLTSPFSGFGVIFAIHWQALKLFMKNMKYRSKPAVPKELLTKAESINPVQSSAFKVKA